MNYVICMNLCIHACSAQIIGSALVPSVSETFNQVENMNTMVERSAKEIKDTVSQDHLSLANTHVRNSLILELIKKEINQHKKYYDVIMLKCIVFCLHIA